MDKNNKLFYFGVLPAIILPLIFTFFYFIVFSDSIIGKMIFASKCIFIAVFPFVFLKLFGTKPADKKHYKKSIVYGLISGALIILLGLLIYFFFFKYFTFYQNNIIGKLKGFDLNNPVLFIILGAYIFIINSFVEEYYWRYFILNGLKLKFNPSLAMILSSVSFTIHHTLIISVYFPITINLILSLIIFIAGLMWCFIYQKTNSLIGSWISHVIADIVIVIIGFIMVF